MKLKELQKQEAEKRLEILQDVYNLHPDVLRKFKRDGSIYVVQNNGQNTGDIFVDISSSQRIKIESEVMPEIKTTAQWHANNFDSTTISTKGKIYIYSDYQTITENNETINIPGYKIGDGLAYIIDLPMCGALTAEKEDF